MAIFRRKLWNRMMRNWKLKHTVSAVICVMLLAALIYESHDFLESANRFQAVSSALRETYQMTRRLAGNGGPADEPSGEGKPSDGEKTGTILKSPEVKSHGPMFIPEYIRRRAKADEVCLRISQKTVSDEAYYLVRDNTTSPIRTTSYCLVPKIACTFWLSVFRFLQNDTRGRSSPLAMTRSDVHYSKSRVPSYKTMAAGASDFRFMFVREPYSRLWSAYVDKLLLPDFWKSDGKLIINKMRGNRTVNACANDISFKEFINYVVTSDPRTMNPHWRPVFHLCNPCTYRPHLIGKLETFSQDARHVLEHMNATWVLDSADHKRRAESEVNQLIDFNFNVARRKNFRNCTNYADVAERLWLAFQINGYLPIGTAFPRQRLFGKLTSDGEALKLIVHEALEAREKGGSGAEWRAQRERAMVQAYLDVPVATMRRLRDAYRQDFDMFGYDPEPPALFRRKT